MKNSVTSTAPAPVAVENLNPSQAAGYTGISESWLAKLRMSENRRRGPAFVKIGKAVIYRRADLDAWIASHLVVAS